MFTPNAACFSIWTVLTVLLVSDIKNSGGSSDTEHAEVTVTPHALSSTAQVIMVTPFANCSIAVL